MPLLDLERRFLLKDIPSSEQEPGHARARQAVNWHGFPPGTWEYHVLRLCWRIEEVRCLILYEDLPEIDWIFDEMKGIEARASQQAYIQAARLAYLRLKETIDQALDTLAEPFLGSLLEKIQTPETFDDPLCLLLEKLRQKQSSNQQQATEAKNGCDEQKAQSREEADD